MPTIFEMRATVLAERRERFARMDEACADPELDEVLARLDRLGSANDNAAPAAAPARRKVGVSVNPRPRKSGARDRRDRDRTGENYLEDQAARGRSFSGNPFPSQTTSKNPNTITNDNAQTNDNKSQTRRQAQDARDTRAPADWKRTTIIGKAGAYQRAIAEFGTPWAWTGNLSPDIIARGQASTEGFASWVLKRVARELRRELSRDPIVVVVTDVTSAGRPHIHGGIALNDNEIPMAERAIARACGRWQARNAERQVDIRPMTDADGWTGYSTRNIAAARRIVGENVIAASAPLKAAGRSLHERLRKMAPSKSTLIDFGTSKISLFTGTKSAYRSSAQANHQEGAAPTGLNNMHIMKTSDFRALAGAIANLRPGLFEERVTVDQIAITLVEADICPAAIFDDMAGDNEEKNQ